MSNALTFPVPKPTHSDKFRGEKYDDALSITQCAARIRADIKEAVRTGALPSGTYSVRTAHGRSINVRISHIPFMIPNRQRVCFDLHHPNVNVSMTVIPHLSDLGNALVDKVKKIVTAYQRDNSDTMTDYFDVNFYEDVTFDWEWKTKQREAMAAQERERPTYEFTLWEAPNHGLRGWTKTKAVASVQAGA